MKKINDFDHLGQCLRSNLLNGNIVSEITMNYSSYQLSCYFAILEAVNSAVVQIYNDA